MFKIWQKYIMNLLKNKIQRNEFNKAWSKQLSLTSNHGLIRSESRNKSIHVFLIFVLSNDLNVRLRFTNLEIPYYRLEQRRTIKLRRFSLVILIDGTDYTWYYVMKAYYYGRRWSYYSGRRTNRWERSKRGITVYFILL